MESDGDYRTLIRASLDGFWLVDGQGRLLDVNDAYCDLSGYTRAELLTMGIEDLEVDQTPAEIARHLQAIRANGSARFDSRHRTRDGSIVDVEVSAHYDAARDRVVAFLRDITAKLAAGRELRQRTDDLTERLKELRCLLDLSTLIARRDLGFDDTMQRAVDLLPEAWRYPALAAAQLTLPDARYATANYRETPRRLVCDLAASEGTRGQLSVVYVEETPGDEADPFLPEERHLLEAVAQRLSAYARRWRVEQELLLREESLNSLLDLSQRALALRERDIIQLALEEVESLTSSEIGYLHFVNADQN